jgi:hypothetical protein
MSGQEVLVGGDNGFACFESSSQKVQGLTRAPHRLYNNAYVVGVN